MASVSQLELRGRGRVPSPKTIEPSISEPVSDDFIESERRSIAASEKEAKEILQKTKPSTALLRSGALSIKESKSLKAARQKASKFLESLGEAKQKLETEIAQKVPERALAPALSTSINKARTSIQAEINKAQEQIKKYNLSEHKARSRGKEERAEDFEDRAEEKTEYLKVYKKALTNLGSSDRGIQSAAIKKFYSGFTRQRANFEEDKEEASNERTAAKRASDKRFTDVYIDPRTGQGFSVTPEIAKQKGYIPARFDYKRNVAEFTPINLEKYTKALLNVPKTPSITDFFGSTKIEIPKITPKSGEVFAPELAGFSSEPFPGSGQGTIITRSISSDEQQLIDAAKRRGSIKGILDIYKGTVVDPLAESKAFKEYEKQVVGRTQKFITRPSIKAIEKGLREYKKSVVTPLREKVPTLGETPIAKVAELKRQIQKLNPETELTIGSGGTRRKVRAKEFQNMGLYEFSKNIVLGEVEETFFRLPLALGVKGKTAKTIGKSTRVTTEFAPYLVSGAFATDVGIQAGEAIGGGEFGGPKSGLEFAQERPIEVGLLGAGVAFKGFKFLKASGKDPASKALYDAAYKKYLKEPAKKKVILFEKTKTVKKTIPEFGVEKKLRKTGDKTFLKFQKKIKGVTKVTQQQPTGEFKGTVEESYKRFLRKQQKLLGKAKFAKGKYTETIELGRGLKKVTKVDKSGKGTIEIFKKGKKVVSLPIESGLSKGGIKTRLRIAKSRVESLKKIANEKSRVFAKEPLKGTGKAIKEGGVFGRSAKSLEAESSRNAYLSAKRDFELLSKQHKKSTVSFKTTPFEKALGKAKKQTTLRIKDKGLSKLKQPEKDLSTALFKKSGKGEIKVSTNFDKGIRETITKIDDVKDIIKVKPSQKVIATSKFTLKERVGQKIIYGKPDKAKKIVDVTVFAKKGKAQVLAKKTEPIFGRVIKQKTGRKIVLESGDDLTRALQKKGQKSYSQSIKDTFTKIKKDAAKKKIEAASKKARQFLIQKNKEKARLLLIQKTKEKAVETLKVPSPKTILPKVKLKPISEIPFLVRAKIPIVSDVFGKLSAGALATGLAYKELTKSKTQQDQKQVSKQVSKLDEVQKFEEVQDVVVVTKTKQKTSQISVPQESFKSVLKIPRPRLPVPKIPVPRIPLIPKVPPTLIETKEKKLIKKKSKVPSLKGESQYFIPEAKRNNKWVKLSKTGLTENTAKGRGARVVDNTIAGRFKITPTASGDSKIIDNYYAYKKDKYRPYKIVKGEKIPLKNTWIEKRGKARIDTQGEKMGLTIAKFLKQKGLAGKKKPTKIQRALGSKLKIPPKGVI